MGVRRRPTLPPPLEGSTIGAEGLSFRVRNGTGRFPNAMTAVTMSSYQGAPTRPVGGGGWCPFLGNRIVDANSIAKQCLGVCEVVGLLVPVSSDSLSSCLPHPAYLPSGLAGCLHPRGGWKPHLEAGFPLRCFQRLSLPNVANQPCSWRNNWHTRGSSVPVLSY